MQDIVLTEGILRWYAENGRDLPWRRTRDPYAVWLSEIILQQTRIAQGRAYWERFMERFPTVADLAAASEDEVLRLWQGLGYYSRARNLHAAARQIVAQGGFPTTLEGIRALPGVGDYTAAAIGSIAFGLPAAVVDGNVYRVLARYYGIATPVGTTAARKEFTALATSLLPAEDVVPAGPGATSGPAAFNQGMMDFGAMVCTPLAPRCADCPLAAGCRAYREGRVELLPVKKPAAAVQERHLTYIYIRCNGFTAIHRRGPGDIWQGLWEPFLLESGLHSEGLSIENRRCATPPTSWAPPSYVAEGGTGFQSTPFCVSAGDASNKSSLNRPVISTGAEGGVEKSVTLLRSNVKHQLTHRTIYADFYLCECSERPSLPPDYIWVPEQAFLTDYGKPRLVELLLEAL
ncbi:MAG: A/G-specific adenine glycosylase [Bacteroidota bacterium]|nr:A/G-specific adenine glycosylase [Bacteroidota bacterium]